jgi:XTP/dITP diphosphohydrolase
MTQTLYFATGNSAKLGQIRYVIERANLPVIVMPAGERFGDKAKYDEIGSTASEIAGYGARVVAERIRQPVLTEDTTFEVEALDGRPGIHAGAYLKKHGRDGILEAMKGETNRRARITSAVAFGRPGHAPNIIERTIDGTIVEQERWTPGLPDWVAPTPGNSLGGGFNAVFVPDGETRTLAEIPPDEGFVLGYREPLFLAVVRWVVMEGVF